MSHAVESKQDGTGVLQWDEHLAPFHDQLKERYARLQKLKQAIVGAEGSVKAFSEPFSRLGFRRDTRGGSHGWLFSEWAPAAHRVALFGDFNGWNRDSHVLAKDEFGVHHVFVPDNPDGSSAIPHLSKYKLHIQLGSGESVDRIPAWCTYSVQDPNTHLYDPVMWAPEVPYVFKHKSPPRPAAPRIYEAHVGIATEHGRVGKYSEFSHVLHHAKAAGYNTVQIMAVMEHSYYASFGYHVTNFFAPSSRFGTPDELRALIDEAHGLGLYVLMDVVHSHSSSNQFDGLSNLDGSGHHYFHEGARGYHSLWDSKLFNYGLWEVLRFLLGNLRYWIEHFHFDGFRFDGVTSMLYQHHGIGVGFSGDYHEYFGDQVDHEAVLYLMLANEMVHELHPNCMTIAEDVSGMPTLCRPVREGGLGFDFRLAMAIPDVWIKLLKEKKDEDWNVGHIAFVLGNRRWMEPVICYSESHDQALVGDKTLAFWLMDAEMYTHFSKLTPMTPVIERGMALHKVIRAITHAMGGEGWLCFMGNEWGHPEWLDFPREGNNWSYHYARRQWNLVRDHDLRYGQLLAFDSQLNAAEDKYRWLCSAPGYVSRKHEGDKLVVMERAGVVFVFNFHPSNSYRDYKIGVAEPGKYKLVLDSDDKASGGHGRYDHSARYFTSPGDWDNRSCSMMISSISRTVIAFAKCDD